MSVTTLTPEQIREAENDPDTIVGRYEPVVLAPDQQLHARTATAVMEAIRSRYLELRLGGIDDDAIRERLRDERDAWKQFAQHTHPTIFKIITNKSTSSARMAVVRDLCRIRSDVDDGKMTEEEGQKAFMDRAVGAQ